MREGCDQFSDEYRYLHPKRGVIWLHHVSRVLERNGSGRSVRLVGVMQDITERKEKEESLKIKKDALRNSQGRVSIIFSWHSQGG